MSRAPQFEEADGGAIDRLIPPISQSVRSSCWRFGFTAAPALTDVQIGSAAQVVNEVTGTLASTRQHQVLRAGIEVFQNEMIDTADASASRVLFQDRPQLSIGPASKVVLDRFIFDRNPSSSVVAVSIAKGVALFASCRSRGKNA